MKIRIGFPFCVTAFILISCGMRESFLCAFFISLLHETGHLIAMILLGIRPVSIHFTPTGIRINCPRDLISCRAECIISASGPLVNLVLMPILYFCDDIPFFINLSLLIINLLPLKSLDAGRFLYNSVIILKDESAALKIMNITETAVCIMLVFLLIVTLCFNIINVSFIVFTVMVVITAVSDIVMSRY